MAGKVIGAVMLVLLLLFFGAAALAAAVASLNPFSGPADTTTGAPSSAPATPGGPPGAAPASGPDSGPVGSVADIPPGYLALYQAAARQCPGLHWAVVAAVGKVESNHGRSALPGVRAGVNPAGAAGPMQFLPATFAAVIARHPIPAGGARPPSPYHPHDAVYAAAFYLCDNGAGNPNRLSAALYRYNHSQAYVAQVLALARRYAAALPTTPPGPRPGNPSEAPGPAGPAGPPPAPAGTSPAVQAALAFARGQLGRPYVWGGNGEPGFDCSGLSKAAYAAAGITLPRTADAQYRAGPRLAANQNLLPGDLVFYGNPATRITHVALYVGNRQVIHAPTPGTAVTTAPIPTRAYAGATRPAQQDLSHRMQRRGASMSNAGEERSLRAEKTQMSPLLTSGEDTRKQLIWAPNTIHAQTTSFWHPHGASRPQLVLSNSVSKCGDNTPVILTGICRMLLYSLRCGTTHRGTCGSAGGGDAARVSKSGTRAATSLNGLTSGCAVVCHPVASGASGAGDELPLLPLCFTHLAQPQCVSRVAESLKPVEISHSAAPATSLEKTP